MAWIDLVTLLAVIEYMVFAALVGRARIRHGVQAPATSGHPEFERYFRVQQNTLELLIVFIPSLWIAAHYWNPAWMALIGVVFPIGRAIYLRAYVREPASRTLGFILSIVPIWVLALFGIAGILRALF